MLMSQAKIYWDLDNYAQVEKVKLYIYRALLLVKIHHVQDECQAQSTGFFIIIITMYAQGEKIF